MNIAQTDPAFPTFSKVFDPAAVIEQLEEYWNKDKKIKIIHCVVADVKYNPGTRCTILYRVKLNQNNVNKEQLFLGKLLTEAESAASMPPHAFHSKTLGMLLAPFPHDPGMPWLPDVNDEKLLLKKLKRMFDKEGKIIESLSIELLAYVPFMRATFNYAITSRNVHTNILETEEWIAKTNNFKSPEIVFGNYWAIWKASNGAIPMPKPTGFMFNPPLTFQGKIKGTRLGALVDSPDFGEMMERTAHTIAYFHGLKAPLLNTRGFEQEARTFNRWSDVLVQLSPAIKTRVNRLKQIILSEMESRLRVEAPIHADFHHTNILVDGVNVQLIDMDEVALGDPCVDIGRFLSSLRIPSLRCFGSFDGLKTKREAFLESYLKKSSRSIRDIRLFEASSLFTSAASTFRLQRPNWEQELSLLIDESETALNSAMEGKPVPVNSSSTLRSDAIDWLQDEIYIQTLLTPIFLKEYHVELTQCRLKEIENLDAYYKAVYSTKAWDVKQEQDTLCEIVVPKKDEECIKFLKKLNRTYNNETCRLVPKIIGEYPGINAYIIELPDGQSLGSVLNTHPGVKIIEQIATELSQLHQPTGKRIPLIFHRAALHHIRVASEGIRRRFPIKKKYGTPQEDVDNFVRLLERFGAKSGNIEYAKKLIERFHKIYRQSLALKNV